MSSKLSKLIFFLVISVFVLGFIFFYSTGNKIDYNMTAQIVGEESYSVSVEKIGDVDVLILDLPDSYPHIGNISFSKNKIYFTDISYDKFYVLDLVDSKVFHLYTSGGSPVLGLNYSGVAIDTLRNYVYIYDLDVNAIFRYNLLTENVDIIVESFNFGSLNRNGGNIQDMLGMPTGYFAMNEVANILYLSNDDLIIEINLNNSTYKIIGGSVEADENGQVTNIISGYQEGGPFSSKFYFPAGIALDNINNILYIADKHNHKVRKIDLSTYESSLIAGSSRGYKDGVGVDAQFDVISGLAIDEENQILYVSEKMNRKIRKIDLLNNTVETVLDIKEMFPNVSLSVGEITLDKTNNLLYASMGNNKLLKIHLPPTESIQNLAPVFSTISDKSINVGETLTFTISATDPDGDTLTYSAINLPSGAVFNTATQTFTWTPTNEQGGAYNVEFSVSDGPLSDTETVTITVNEARILLEITKLGSFDFSNRAYDIFVRGDDIYLIDRADGLFVVDATDPTNIAIKGRLSLTPNTSSEIDVVGNYAYITESSGFQLQILDISDPANPWMVKGVDEFPGEEHALVQSLVVKDGFAYLLDAFIDQGLKMVDVSQPSQPVLKWNIPLFGKGNTIKESNNILAIGVSHTINQVGGGFYLKKITQPGEVESILFKSSTQIGKTVHDAIGINKDWAAVSGKDSNGEKVLFVIDIWSQEMNAKKIGASIKDIAIDNDYVFVLFNGEDPFTDNSIIGVYDLSDFDSSIISEVERFEVPQWARVMEISNNRLYVMEDDGEVQIYQLSIVTSNQPPVLEIYNPTIYLGNKTIKNIDLGAGEQISLKEGESISVSIDAADVDNDDLVFSAYSNTMPVLDLANPLGPYFNPFWQTFTWHTDYGDAGIYDLTFTVTDGKLSDSETITITILDADSAPVLRKIGDKSVAMGKTLTFSISATDPDGDTLTYSVANLPSDAIFNTTTQTFTWVPTDNQSGAYNVEFSVSDGSLSDVEAVIITVTDVIIDVIDVNSSPVLDSVGDKSINVGETLTFTISATDPDGDTLTYSAANLPISAFFNIITKIFIWIPTPNQVGSHEIEFFVSDSSLSVSEMITATVLEPSIIGTPPPKEESILEMTISELKAKITEIFSAISILKKELAELTGQPSYEGVPPKFRFTRNIKYGMIGWDVHYFQIILKTEVPSFYPVATRITGWFGPITRRAAVAFQEKYSKDILVPLGYKKGTGFVGKSTKSKLNQLLDAE